MDNDNDRRGLTRRRILLIAGGGVAAAAGIEALAGCGETSPDGESSLASDEHRTHPSSATTRTSRRSRPSLCSLLSFFDRHQALTVEAYTARLLPGDEADPGARELCVTHYIDRKLAQYRDFATPDLRPATVREAGQGPSRPAETATRSTSTRRTCRSTASSPRRRRRTPTETGIDGARHGDTVALRQRTSSTCPSRLQDEVIAGMQATDPSAKPGDYPPAAVKEGKRLKPFFAPPAPSAFGFFKHAPGRHERGRLRRPDLRRQPLARRLEADRLPGRATRLDGGRAQARPARANDPGPRATCRR